MGVKEGNPRPACTKVPKTGITRVYAGCVPILLRRAKSSKIVASGTPVEAFTRGEWLEMNRGCARGVPRCIELARFTCQMAKNKTGPLGPLVF